MTLLILVLPFVASADGVVLPTLAYPAKVSIPDQQAAVSFSNGLERLVIETHFSGVGSNFAWVIPLPNQPLIQPATAGFFPTLQYLCRPEIIHELPHYYASVLALMGLGYILLFVRPTGRLKWIDLLACGCVGGGATTSSPHEVFAVVSFCIVTGILVCDVVLIRIAQRAPLPVFVVTFAFFFCLLGLLLPAGTPLQIAATPAPTSERVSVLDRKIAGIFETATIASQDPKALQSWLSENGYAIPTNAEPVIAGYVKENWIFVTVQVRRESAAVATSTPHPLSFTFKTAKPVYPMQLTGLNREPLNVDLFVLGETSATAPFFTVEKSDRQELRHPLLSQWFGSSPVITKLTARLLPAEMDKDVWISLSPNYVRHVNVFYSHDGALTTALNLAAYVFGAGLFVVCCWALAMPKLRPKLFWIFCALAIVSAAVGKLRHDSLPQMAVKLVRGGFRHHEYEHILAVERNLEESNFTSMAEVRAAVQNVISNPAYTDYYGSTFWENKFVGGNFREEDSPGNYLLRETNRRVELVVVDANGTAWTSRKIIWPLSFSTNTTASALKQ
ncbi:MAG TPA: DUF2330 domain-containing protein [Verrucomicrobiae bacterium]